MDFELGLKLHKAVMDKNQDRLDRILTSTETHRKCRTDELEKFLEKTILSGPPDVREYWLDERCACGSDVHGHFVAVVEKIAQEN